MTRLALRAGLFAVLALVTIGCTSPGHGTALVPSATRATAAFGLPPNPVSPCDGGVQPPCFGAPPTPRPSFQP